MTLIDKEYAYATLMHEADIHSPKIIKDVYTHAAQIIEQMKPVETDIVRNGHWIEKPHYEDETVK